MNKFGLTKFESALEGINPTRIKQIKQMVVSIEEVKPEPINKSSKTNKDEVEDKSNIKNKSKNLKNDDYEE